MSLQVAFSQNYGQTTFMGLTKPTSVIEVWTEGKMPGNSATEPEMDMPSKGDGVQRISNISRPTLSL